jgi:thiol-disulfide isomerase/thioredoxin
MSLNRVVAIISLALISQSAWAANPVKAIHASEFKQILNSHRGDLVVVNFWATWCAPCLKEIPDLLKLQKEKSSEGMQLIGIAVDEPTANSAEVERFRSRYFPEFRTYARAGVEMDELAQVIDPSWNEVVPTTYLLDREGRVVKRIQGKKTLEEFRTALEAISRK